MRNTLNRIVPVLVAVLCVSPVQAQNRGAERARRPLVQIAILLDNSGSMNGLINQARSELWSVVNELATARYDGERPDLRVALYKYGNPPAQMLVPLTDDLDRVSDELFKLGVEGGSEYCGQVIDIATRDLEWGTSADDLKLIFIAGNEAFTQGPVDYRKACQSAIAKGIIVNTIHCGEGVPDGWRNGAALADGRSMSINSNQAVAYIDAPQDEEIARLGVELNTTYIPYGEAGREGATNQSLQDGNSASFSRNNASKRAVTKASGFYRNSNWDLVDALKESSVDLEKIDKDTLPEGLRELDDKALVAHVEAQQSKRTEIQKRINELDSARKRYVAEERKKQADAGDETLDRALISTIRSQATQKNFKFD